MSVSVENKANKSDRDELMPLEWLEEVLSTGTIPLPLQTRVIPGLVNDYKDIDGLLSEANHALDTSGILIGKMRTIYFYKQRQLKKKWSGKPVYYCSVLFHRVFPKLNRLFYRFYLFVTKGKAQRVSRTELLGRLIKNGFDIQQLNEDDNGILFFQAEKKRIPVKDRQASYWPIFKMKRVGKNGKQIFVYKIRTMHPYAEYVQEYIKQQHGLEKSGKFLNDFRVTSWGKFLRKYWLDETPMIINLLKGDIKLIGVRPISASFMKLYPDRLIKMRNEHKPGLLPPYYADMPGNFDEILSSEERYLEECKSKPFKTDLKYFWAILRNIIFKRARSK